MASNELKRTGLVFKADGTVDFKKSIKDINNELSNNYQQLKLTQSQYDKNTTVTQKLKDKFESMTKAVELQKEKVKILTAELEELESAEIKDEDAIQKKKKALNDAEIKLNNYKSTLNATEEELKKSTSLIEQFSDKATAASEKLEKVGKVTSVVGGGLTAAGALAVKSFNKVDDGMDVIVKKTGATGEALDDLNDVFKNISSTIPAEFGDIGAAVGEINTRLGLTGGALEDCTEKFLQYARVNDTDVNNSVQLVTRAMANAGIETDKYGELLDSLTMAGQMSGISVDTLATDLTKYGNTFKELNINTNDAIAMLSKWEKEGVNADVALTGMKKALQSFTKDGKDSKVEFANLIEGIQNGSISASDAMSVLGNKAGPELYNVIQSGKFGWQEYSDILSESGGIIDSTYSNLVDGADDMQLAQQNVDLALSQLGETISSFFGPILVNLSKWFKDLMEKFDNLDPKVKNIIMKVSTFVIVAGPALLLLSKIVGSISGFIGAIGKLKSAFTGIFSVIKTVSGLLNLKLIIIGAIIAGIALLVVAVVKNWDKIKEVIGNALKSVKNFFDLLGQAAWKVLEDIGNAFISFKDGTLEIFQNIDDFLTNIFSIDFSERFGFLGEVLNVFLANFKNIYESIKQIFQGIIDFVTGIFTGNWEKAWKGIMNIASGLVGGLLSIVKAPFNGIIGFLNMIIDGINFLINGINKISFDVPDWVPGIGGKTLGFDIPTIGKLAYMAKGGELLQGSAIIAEAGPEMLLQQGNKTKVVPLNNSSKNKTDIIDYEKIFKMIIKALNSCKMKLDREGWIRFINEQIWEATKDV